jgi:hypothetical protein
MATLGVAGHQIFVAVSPGRRVKLLIEDRRGYGADAHLLVTAVVMPLPALLAVLDHLARCWIVLAPRTLGRPQRHSVDDSVA